MLLTRFLPAVTFAVTATSLTPVLADAAPSLRAAPPSTAATRPDSVPRLHRKTRTVGAAHIAMDVREAVTALPTPGGATITPVPAHSSIRAAVKLLLNAINTTRMQRGLAPLQFDGRLSRCSLAHSEHMAARHQISHDQFPADICTPHRYAGENVGVGRQAPGNAVLLLNRAMIDEGPCPSTGCTGLEYEQHGHYLNIINPVYKRLGIGIVVKNGATWLTEDFTS